MSKKLDIIEGFFLLYSSFKFVCKFKSGVSALVMIPDFKVHGSFLFLSYLQMCCY